MYFGQQEDITVIVPPQMREEEEYQLDWDKIDAGISGLPVQYPLTLRGERSEEEEEDVPSLSIICHRVKVQRYEYH